MAKKTADSLLKPGTAGTGEGHSGIKPLTRRGYKRLPETERQIADAAVLDAKALLARARHRDEAEPEYLAAEALVHFIRRADRNSDLALRDGLFRELFERCTRFFRGRFRGFNKATREDLQQEVLKKVVEDILARDDHFSSWWFRTLDSLCGSSCPYTSRAWSACFIFYISRPRILCWLRPESQCHSTNTQVPSFFCGFIRSEYGLSSLRSIGFTDRDTGPFAPVSAAES